MKKIFYILASAIVALGAVACENEGLDNIAPEGKGETLSFTAEIDNTRIALNGLNTVWAKGDVLVIKDYTFVCQNDGKTFIGEGDGINAAFSTDEELTVWYNENLDSSKGLNGVSMMGVGKIVSGGEAKLTFSLQCALLKYTTTEEVKFEGTALSAPFTPASKDGVQYIPVKAGEGSISYSVGGVQCKSLVKNFEVRKIYNLGELYGPSDWEISGGIRFLKTATPDLFVAKNVKLAANNFCLHKVGDTAWGAGAKYGLVNAGTKSENTVIALYSASWANDVTISNATTTAHDIYFDYANSRLYVMTVGNEISSVTAPTHSNWYNIGGSMNGWGSTDAKYKFTYSGDNVWHIVFDFKANDEFKVKLKNDWGTCYGHNNIQNEVGKSLSSGSDNIKIKTAGTYEIWVVTAHNPQLYIIKR